ncbi:MAG: CDP-glycerol glycerophosphotransferase family protein [Planctomycetota bacterium]
MLSLPIGRRGASKILFYAESPVKYAMFRPIQRLMEHDSRIEFFFAGQLRGAFTSRNMARQLNVKGARSLRRGIAALCRFDLFLTADYDLWGPFEREKLPISAATKVQVFHGASVRNGAIQPKMKRYGKLMVVGPYMFRSFIGAGIFQEDDPRLAKVGMPKTDRLLDGSFDGAAIRAEFGLDPDRPTVLLAPTWLRKSPIFDFGEELIERLADGPWNLVVKLHDKFFDPRFNLIDWRSRLRRLEQRKPCTVIIDQHDATPLLFVTDLLISDVSSISNEFSLLDRPMVFLQVGDVEALKAQYPHLDLDTWGQRAGEVAHDAASCVAAVERGLADPGRDSEIRRALARDVFYNPGCAAAVAVSVLYDTLGLPARPEPAGETVGTLPV